MSVLFVLGSGLLVAGQIGAESEMKHDAWSQQMQHALNLEAAGDFAQAERALIASIHQAEQPWSDPEWLPTALDRLGVLNWDLGRTRQAEPFYLRAADLWQTRFGASSLGLATTLSDLAWMYSGLGDPSRAESLWRRSLEIRTPIPGSSHPTVAQIYGYMAVSAFGARRLGAAESHCQKALGIYERGGQFPEEAGEVLSSLASVRRWQGRPAEAIQLMNEAIALEEPAKHPSIRLLGGYFYNLALAESAAAQPANAEAHFGRALSLLAGPPYATQTLRCNILYSYAHFLADTGRKKDAKTVQRQAANVARIIRRENYAEYATDISSYRKSR